MSKAVEVVAGTADGDGLNGAVGDGMGDYPLAELSGKTVDGQKAAALQKKISDLRSQLDQKRLEHLLKVKEMFPDLDDHFEAFCFKGGGPGRGAGYGGCR